MVETFFLEITHPEFVAIQVWEASTATLGTTFRIVRATAISLAPDEQEPRPLVKCQLRTAERGAKGRGDQHPMGYVKIKANSIIRMVVLKIGDPPMRPFDMVHDWAHRMKGSLA